MISFYHFVFDKGNGSEDCNRFYGRIFTYTGRSRLCFRSLEIPGIVYPQLLLWMWCYFSLKFHMLQGQPDLMVGVQPAVKAALTKAYKQRENERRVRSSDLLPVFTLSGQKKLPKKRTRLQISPPELEVNELAEDDEELEGTTYKWLISKWFLKSSCSKLNS